MASPLARSRAALSPLLSHLSSFLSPEDVDLVAGAFASKRCTTFRINTLKADCHHKALESIQKWHPCRLIPCPFYPHAYLVDDPDVDLWALIDTPAHKVGLCLLTLDLRPPSPLLRC